MHVSSHHGKGTSKSKVNEKGAQFRDCHVSRFIFLYDAVFILLWIVTYFSSVLTVYRCRNSGVVRIELQLFLKLVGGIDVRLVRGVESSAKCSASAQDNRPIISSINLVRSIFLVSTER